ncbi:MAG: hypothetical protein K6F09_06380 [Clostridiales bacterium]|nr:hypothetical protein [Clostridiales bacterium]
MKQSSKTALGGIVAALSVTILFAMSVIPFLTYALPALAGAFIALMVIEANKKWAFGVYVAVSILSVVIVPDKEAAVLYASFFGYYPIIKALCEAKLPRWLEWIIKLALFEGTMIISYYLMIKFMGVEFDEVENFGRFAVPILLALGTAAFVMYDYALTMFISIYLKKWHKKFRRLFK